MKKSLFREGVKLCLENAEQWMNDAKLLMDNSSYGHSYSLLVFADEEIAKAYICWLVAEDMIPVNSKFVQDTFSKHRTKHETLVGIFLGAMLKEDLSKGQITIEQILKESSALTIEKIEKALEEIEKLLDFTEMMRQKGIYVDKVEGRMVSPKSIGKEESEELLQGVEHRFDYVKRLIGEISPSEKRSLKQFFKSLPKKVWDTR